MRANILLKANIQALLRARHQTQKDLAVWCYRTESWISKVFKEDRREFSMKDLDRIADFFGLVAYQLFQPGLAPRSERRLGADRRTSKERRMSDAQRVMLRTAEEIDFHHSRRRAHVVAASPTADALKRAVTEFEARIAPLIRAVEIAADAGQQTPTARQALAGLRQGRGAPRGSDAGSSGMK